MIKEYIKTTPVKAVQVTPDNHDEVKEFVHPQSIGFGLFHVIDTLEGEMYFYDSDYLIKNPTGECYVCAKDIFEKTYKEIK